MIEKSEKMPIRRIVKAEQVIAQPPSRLQTIATIEEDETLIKIEEMWGVLKDL